MLTQELQFRHQCWDELPVGLCNRIFCATTNDIATTNFAKKSIKTKFMLRKQGECLGSTVGSLVLASYEGASYGTTSYGITSYEMTSYGMTSYQTTSFRTETGW
jgi:hypothetical protein